MLPTIAPEPLSHVYHSMNPRPTTRKTSPLSTDQKLARRLWIVRFGLLISGSISAYLLSHALTHEQIGGCGPGSACDRVLGSHWAYLGPIPVSALALFVYVSLFLTTFQLTPNSRPQFRSNPWRIAIALSAAILFAALWFVGLQVVHIGVLCKFCVGAHLAGSAAAVACLQAAWTSGLQHPSKIEGSTKPALRGVRVSAALLAFLVGGLATGTTALLQYQFPHRLNIVRVHRGSFKLNLSELPRLGSASATRVFVSLFDYTCPDCQTMHKHLEKALEHYGDELGIVTLPVPLDSKCNPLVRRTQPKHQEACEYAKLGMAVQRVSSKAFTDYDAWFFSQPVTPPLTECVAKATSLTGIDALKKAQSDPWVDQTIQTAVSLYEWNGNITGVYRMPQLVIGDRVNVGPVASSEELYRLLEDHLGVAARKSKHSH